MAFDTAPSLKLVQAYVDALNNKDGAAMAAIIDPDLKFQLLPSTLNGPLVPDRDAFIGLLEKLGKVTRSTEMNILDVNASPSKVWAHVSGSSELINGTTYKGEYVYMWDVAENADGTLRIVKSSEMVDAVEIKTLLAAGQPSSG